MKSTTTARLSPRWSQTLLVIPIALVAPAIHAEPAVQTEIEELVSTQAASHSGREEEILLVSRTRHAIQSGIIDSMTQHRGAEIAIGPDKKTLKVQWGSGNGTDLPVSWHVTLEAPYDRDQEVSEVVDFDGSMASSTSVGVGIQYKAPTGVRAESTGAFCAGGDKPGISPAPTGHWAGLGGRCGGSGRVRQWTRGCRLRRGGCCA